MELIDVENLARTDLCWREVEMVSHDQTRRPISNITGVRLSTRLPLKLLAGIIRKYIIRHFSFIPPYGIIPIYEHHQIHKVIRLPLA